MSKYIIKRLLLSVVILFFVALIVYTIMRCIPASFAETTARQLSSKPGAPSYQTLLKRLNEIYHMDRGIIPGYISWIGDALRGNFGDSWKFNIPVTTKFAQVIWFSFFLSAVAFILELVIAIPLGILAARRQYSKTDYAVTVVALAGISLPTFFLATILKVVFGMKLQWIDYVGIVSRYHLTYSPFRQVLDYGAHYILPIITIVIISIGGLMRYTRTNMLEVMNADFIRTARAKGLPEGRVINYHAFRNTLIPLITIVGQSIPDLFGGALITETLYQIPGIGYTSYTAMISGDIPFTMFYLSFLAILTLLGNLLADIFYAAADPRVRVA